MMICYNTNADAYVNANKIADTNANVDKFAEAKAEAKKLLPLGVIGN